MSINFCSGLLNLLYKRYPTIANPTTPIFLRSAQQRGHSYGELSYFAFVQKISKLSSLI